jgi:RNA polymerase sigma-70 factor (ECF subfamily)
MAWLRLANPEPTPRRRADEDALIPLAQGGDGTAFSELAGHYYDGLYRWLYHLTRDRHAAEDLTQEALMKAFRGLGSFRAGTNFRAWLFRIAHNSFLNSQRKAARPVQSFPEQLATSAPGPEEEAAGRETEEIVARAVARLPAEFRAAFLLRVEQGLSFREIAGVLATSEQTARWRVFKARQKLLHALAPQPDPTEP